MVLSGNKIRRATFVQTALFSNSYPYWPQLTVFTVYFSDHFNNYIYTVIDPHKKSILTYADI